MNQDHTGTLDDEPFEYHIFKDNKIQISYNGKPVMMLKGLAALDLIVSFKDRMERRCS